MKRFRGPVEEVTSAHVAVYHTCGAQVLVTEVAFGEGGVRMIAICPRCGRYVRLRWRRLDPLAHAWPMKPEPLVAPTPDMTADQYIEELENRLTLEYAKRSLRDGKASRR